MSIQGAITSYQNINDFYVYNSLKIDTPERIQDENSAVSSASNDIPSDSNAAFASISPEATALYESEQQSQQEENTTGSNQELTQQEQQEVSELKTTDAQVKAHEHAHKSAAAGLTTSGPNYEYETGPDGRKYAVAGDVNVSYQKSSDPQVNLQNAQKLKAAALAPADPSAQDRSVARKADAEIAQARQEIMEEAQATEEEEQTSEATETDNANNTTDTDSTDETNDSTQEGSFQSMES